MKAKTSSKFSLARRCALVLLTILTLTMFLIADHVASAAEAKAAKAWTGTWSNRKFNTTGELTCTVVGEQSGQWIAKFTGTGLGKPFTYTALITAKKSGTNTTLQGSTKVDGDSYAWSGTIVGESMTGSFRSTTGNNGAFQLKEKK